MNRCETLFATKSSYTCPDGTVVYLSEFLDNDTYSTPDDLAQNPPHWCEEAIDWVANLNFFNWAKFCCLWIFSMLFMSGFLMEKYGPKRLFW